MTLQKLKWFALIFVIGVAGLLFLLSFRQSSISPTLRPSDTLILFPITLRIDFGDGDVQNFSDIPYVTGATVFSILEDIAVKEKIPFVYDPSAGVGVFIRQIGDKKNGDGGRYWQYWVNEKFAMVAADKYMLSAGDIVEWKFLKEQK
ncbi:MAG: DUF4430 domain-containing protein [bacterium]|nr:DUF4430 domain-containing protein [bacterium]